VRQGIELLKIERCFDLGGAGVQRASESVLDAAQSPGKCLAAYSNGNGGR